MYRARLAVIHIAKSVTQQRIGNDFSRNELCRARAAAEA